MVGTMLTVKITCVYTWTWLVDGTSRPASGRQPVGNILTAAAILSEWKHIWEHPLLHEPPPSAVHGGTHIQEIHNGILLPVIGGTYIQGNTQWNTPNCHQPILQGNIKDVRESLQGKCVIIWGDRRCDSPGYKAKYCTYTCISMGTKKIEVMELVKITEASSSVAMEKIRFCRAVGSVIEEVDVKVVASNRQTSIRKLMRKEHSTIDHQFDVWHFTKSVGKELTAKAKRKNC